MLTLGGIQLRGFFRIRTEVVEDSLNFRYPNDIDSKQSMRQALQMFDAYLTLTDLNPQTMGLDGYAGFRGFLHRALRLNEDDEKPITRQLLDYFILVGCLEEEQANLAFNMSQAKCNENYQEREPTKCQFLHYQSLFPTSDPNGFVYVDFDSIRHLLSKASFDCLGRLLTEYLAQLPTMQAEIDGPLIIAIAQGLLYDKPGVDFGNIHLSAGRSAEFIGNVRTVSEWRMHDQGFLRGDVAENWKYLTTVLTNFFVANHILCLNKDGRHMLRPY